MEQFMENALIYAKKANEINEVPVGCVFIWKNNVIAGACNEVNKTKNATRHAEMVCTDQVLEYCKENQLNHNEVFAEISCVVTCEPCIMCAAALCTLNIKDVYFGCHNDRFGGKTVLNVFDILKSPIKVTGGIRADDAMELLKTFYKGENLSAPESKRKKKSDE